MNTQLLQRPGTTDAAHSIWTIDSTQSRIAFSISHMKFATVHGQFNRFSGYFRISDNRLDHPEVHVAIDAASIDTGEPRRDAHLRSADFFDVPTWPSITFDGTRLEPVSPVNFDRWLVAGDLTIRGTTRRVKLAVQINDGGPDFWDGGMVELSATTMIRRKDFGVGLHLPLERAGLLIGDDVNVSIAILALRD